MAYFDIINYYLIGFIILKKKIIFILSFFILAFLFTYVIFSLIENRKKEHLDAEKKIIEVTYNTIIEAYKVYSNIIYFNKLNTKDTKSILENVYTSSKEEQSQIRAKLYTHLIDMYNNMEDYKLKQLHFHLKDNESFLRFHRPDRYGDNLTNVRLTVAYVNEHHKAISGFEEGRIYNGYRFVYPLEYNGVHLGSVETSVSMKSIINDIKKELTSEVDFIIKKSIVENKVFEEEQDNYFPCTTDNHFYHEKSITDIENPYIESILKNYYKENPTEIRNKINSNEIFNFYSKYNDDYYITTYLPIKNVISNQTVAYILISTKHNDLQDFINQYLLFLFLLLLLTISVLYFIYRIDKTKSLLFKKDKVLNEVQKIAKLGYWELDILENKLKWSDEVYHIFGLAPQEFEATYEAFLKYVHPDDVNMVNKAYTDSLRNKSSYQVEHRVITKSGEVKYVEEECRHTFDEYGDVVQSLGTIHDLTSIKLYQQKIKKSKDQFESLVSHIPDMIYRCEIDKDFTMLYVNNAIETITGYKIDEIRFNKILSFASIIHPNDLNMVYKKTDEMIKNNIVNIDLEYRIISKDGRVIWINDNLQLIRNDNHIYLEGVISDVTSQKIAYDKLYKFIDSQDNIVILTTGKNIEFANKKFFHFLGFEDLDTYKISHKCISDLFIKNEKFFDLSLVNEDENWVNVIQTLSYRKRVVAIKGINGTTHAFSVTINKFEDAIYIVSFTDISDTMLENIQLEEKTLRDKLTNAYNREFFENNYKRLIDTYKDEDMFFALTMVDIDDFKKINDNFGHNIGDQVLINLVSKIEKTLRSDDVLIRWGGEEFIILLKVSSKEALELVLEKLRNTIENSKFKNLPKITCSFGGTLYENDENIIETIKRADMALYTAKANGKNKITIKS
jgi:diguanylate cyclase (GGDEF)-like protein/PAS domain S-box-containing protein